MSLIPAKDYYGKDESITSVRRAPLLGAKLVLTSILDPMAEKEEADSRGAPGGQASEAGPGIAQVRQRCHGRECAEAKT